MLNEIHLFQFFLNPSFQRKIFWAKAILKTLTFTCTLNAYVTRTKQSTRFHSRRVNTEPFENVQKSPSKLSNEKIRLFLKRSSELEKLLPCPPLFSINVVIGQFSSNWPGSSNATVKKSFWPGSTNDKL